MVINCCLRVVGIFFWGKNGNGNVLKVRLWLGLS